MSAPGLCSDMYLIGSNTSTSINDFSEIPFLNPNIEDFVSTRMRYKDLKS